MPRILFVSAIPFHSSRVWPFSMALSIHGIRLPARGAPSAAVGNPLRMAAVINRSSARILLSESSSPAPASPRAFICATSSRICLAPAPDAAW